MAHVLCVAGGRCHRVSVILPAALISKLPVQLLASLHVLDTHFPRPGVCCTLKARLNRFHPVGFYFGLIDGSLVEIVAARVLL